MAKVGNCQDCNQAMSGSARTSFPDTRGMKTGGSSFVYVGPCQGGFVYRVTNLGRDDLPPFVIAENGEVWKIPGRIKNGESFEFRSKTILHNVVLTPRP
jgi:hypothetical protein